MEGLSANKGLLITLGGSALAVAGLTSGSLPALAEYLELVPLPTDECAARPEHRCLTSCRPLVRPLVRC